MKVISGFLDDFELWFELPAAYGKADTADAFLAAALMVAMKRREPITVDRRFPVSFKLLQGMRLIQDLYCAWYPDVEHVPVEAEVTESTPAQPGYASFFSGGVDSLYTFLRREEDITHLVFLGGVDIQLDNAALYATALDNNQQFAREHDRTLVPVVSNLRELCYANGMSWGNRYAGAGLASVALLLGFPYTLVPASQSHDLHYPDATSPALDHLFSNEATTIYYDGALSRPQKIKYLGRIPGSMDRLRVCWQDKGYNCGQCEKCVRTMLLLTLYGLECPTLPPFPGLYALRGLRIETDGQKRITAGLIAAARETGNRRIYRYLVRFRRREALKRWLAATDREAFGGFFKGLYRRLRGSDAASFSRA